jgi:hypothetical protein
MPTDEKEQDRYVMSGLNTTRESGLLADLDQRILDVGTGSGIWTIDMADQYPMAEVVGTDLSPIQPSWVPPNWFVFYYMSLFCLSLSLSISSHPMFEVFNLATDSPVILVALR